MLKSDFKPIICSCSGKKLTEAESDLFAKYKPIGLILFQRNCVSKSQVIDLISGFKKAIGWEDAPILIDQEGGTVARLKSPEWVEFPPAVEFSKLAETDLETAKKSVYDNSILMGEQLAELGVMVNCAPVMDVPSPECHGFLADSRSYGKTAEQVTDLANEVCRGLLETGVTPVMKHIPGHGRGTVDSHKSLPHVSASLKDLQEVDYLPFKKLASSNIGKALWGMGAHIIYDNVDAERPATVSKTIVNDVIRNEIGFDGVLIADDIGMKALTGKLSDIANETIEAGYDLTLHCSGIFSEIEEILPALPPISDKAMARIIKAEEMRVNGI